MKASIPLALLVACSPIAGSALAAEPAAEPRLQVVRYADLDLSSQAGAASLYARIAAAAREVCPVMVERQLASIGRARRCTEDAVARAVEDVNVAAVTSLHFARTGQQLGTPTSAALRRDAGGTADGGSD